MYHDTHVVSIRGKQCSVPAIRGNDILLVVKGKLLKIAHIHDEVWLESKNIPNHQKVIEGLRNLQDHPDIFTFAQRIPDHIARYNYYFELENFAVARTNSYQTWFEQAITKGARKKIRKAAKQGVTTELVALDDELVQGIKSIYDESNYRQGKPFWHFGKDASLIKEENGTYLDRSAFIGAYYNSTLIGFVKLVFLGTLASTMQVISKMEHFDKAPNNALLAKAISVCSSRGVEFLTYGQYSYGNRGASSLTDFKAANGFFKMEVPRYYVPLTVKGDFILRSGIRKIARSCLSSRVMQQLLEARSRVYNIYLRR